MNIHLETLTVVPDENLDEYIVWLFSEYNKVSLQTSQELLEKPETLINWFSKFHFNCMVYKKHKHWMYLIEPHENNKNLPDWCDNITRGDAGNLFRLMKLAIIKKLYK